MRLRTILLGGVVLVVGAVAAGAVVVSRIDPNAYRGTIADQAKAFTGRDLAINGDLKLGGIWALSPSLDVANVTFANATWGSRPEMLKVGRFEVEVDLVPLLSGNIRVKRIVLNDPDILLETNAQGQGNWEFGAPSAAPAPGPTPGQSAGGARTLPQVNEVEIRNAKVVYRDGQNKGATKTLTLARAIVRADSESSPLKIDVDGALDALKFQVAGQLGAVTALTSPGAGAFPIDVTGKVGDLASFKAKGQVQEPAAGKGYDVALNLEGAELSKLAELGGYRVTAIGPFKIDVQVNDKAAGGNPSVASLKAEIGRQDLVLVRAEGAVADPLNQKGIALNLSVEGKELGAFSGFSAPGAPVLPRIPALGPFKANVRVANAADGSLTVPELKLEAGKPELAMVKVAGAIADPLNQKGVTLNVDLEGREVGAFSGLSLPGMAQPLPPVPALGPFKGSVRVVNGPGGDPSLPELKFELGKANLLHVVIDGSVQDPMDAKGVKVELKVEAPEITKVAALAGTAAPVNGPLKLEAALADLGPGRYSVKGIKLALGPGDLEGEATLSTAGPKMALSANLSSNAIDISKLSSGRAPAAPAPAKPSDKMFSDDPLPFTLLNMADADVKYTAKRFVTPDGVLQNVNVAVTLKGGDLNVKPLALEYAGSKINGEIAMAARNQSFSTKLEVRGFKTGEYLREAKITDYLRNAPTDVTVDLRGSGRSMRALMASLNGTTTVVVGQGQIDSRLYEILGADVVKVLNPLGKGQSESRLNCVVQRFEFVNGLATSKVWTMDTNNTTATGEGTLNFATEVPSLLIDQKPKDTSILGVVPPIRVGGTFTNLSFLPDAAGTALGIAKTVGGAALMANPIGLAAGLVAKNVATSQPQDACTAALAQVGINRPAAAAPAAAPAQQRAPAPANQQRPGQPAQQPQQPKPANPIDNLGRGLRGVLGN